ncbi:MAG: hypothetical protein MHMPM18_002913 [Marteilia pararefringens]
MHRTKILLTSLLMVMLPLSSVPNVLSLVYVNSETIASYTNKERDLYLFCHRGFNYQILSYYDKEIIDNRFDEDTATLCRAMFISAIIYIAFISICCIFGPCGVGICAIVYCFCNPKNENKVGTHRVQKPDVDQNANKIEF